MGISASRLPEPEIVRGYGNRGISGPISTSIPLTPPPTSTSPPQPPLPQRYISIGPIASDNGIRVVCPRCRSVLMPPAPIFRCPCGEIMSFRLPATSSLTSPYLSRQPGSGSSSSSSPLETRILAVLQRLPATDPHAAFLRSLLERLPRHPDGSLDARGLDMMEHHLQVQVRGASEELLSLLPTRKWVPTRASSSSSCSNRFLSSSDRLPLNPEQQQQQTKAETTGEAIADNSSGERDHAAEGPPPILTTPSDGAVSTVIPSESQSTTTEVDDTVPSATNTTIITNSEHTQCAVCLEQYEEGDDLRTLPCFHMFHISCIDPWLRSDKKCPVCKTAIDVDSSSLLMMSQTHHLTTTNTATTEVGRDLPPQEQELQPVQPSVGPSSSSSSSSRSSRRLIMRLFGRG